jgi:hypothetical protein
LFSETIKGASEGQDILILNKINRFDIDEVKQIFCKRFIENKGFKVTVRFVVYWRRKA